MTDFTFQKGSSSSPLAVFIHGLGLAMESWTEPAAQKIFIGTKRLSEHFCSSEMMTSFNDLKEKGFSVLTWTQRRPAGPVSIAVDELENLLIQHKKYVNNGLVIFGHSRGGLIARKFLENSPYNLRMLVTVGTPHQGSGLCDLAKKISIFSSAVARIQPDREDVSGLVKAARLMQSRGFKELYTGSHFLSSLKNERARDAGYISVGGTNPDLVKIKKQSLADILSRYLPGFVVPDELKTGIGDGLVTCNSAVLPYADEHKDFHCNHLALLFAKEVREYLLSAVSDLF
ncbi:MAG: hypothetical protein RBT37_09040 [Dissulfurispiraceae bacterium]|jgi:pimeloyl-ACP methyl ester carboxylesterase|nr:hypothetical protein [Dissulfurispiraceae bacterium]